MAEVTARREVEEDVGVGWVIQVMEDVEEEMEHEGGEMADVGEEMADVGKEMVDVGGEVEAAEESTPEGAEEEANGMQTRDSTKGIFSRRNITYKTQPVEVFR